jgi:hypothetical protein
MLCPVMESIAFFVDYIALLVGSESASIQIGLSHSTGTSEYCGRKPVFLRLTFEPIRTKSFTPFGTVFFEPVLSQKPALNQIILSQRIIGGKNFTNRFLQITLR